VRQSSIFSEGPAPVAILAGTEVYDGGSVGKAIFAAASAAQAVSG
jgi:hypothetical protein